MTTSSALIIIDLINSSSKSVKKIVNELAEYCYTTPEIKTIIVHTSGEPGFDTHDELLAYREKHFKGTPHLKERPIWHTANKLYSSANDQDLLNEWSFINDYRSFFRNKWSEDEVENNKYGLLKGTGYLPFVRPMRSGLTGTHPKILNLPLRPDQTLIGCWSMLQLKHITDCYPTDNFVYAGGSLEICLKDRKIGYNNVFAANQTNYFSTTKNIIAKSDFIYDNTGRISTADQYTPDRWDRINDTMYKLIS